MDFLPSLVSRVITYSHQSAFLQDAFLICVVGIPTTSISIVFLVRHAICSLVLNVLLHSGLKSVFVLEMNRLSFLSKCSKLIDGGTRDLV